MLRTFRDWLTRRTKGPEPGDVLLPGKISMRSLARNLCVMGATGSGKTSYLKRVVRVLLRHGYGLFICGAKPGAAVEFAAMAVEEGREADLRPFTHGPDSCGINLSDAVRNPAADPQGQALQLAEAFRQSVDAMQAGRGDMRSGERFFELNADDLTRRSFLAQLLAGLNPSVPLVRRMLESRAEADGELSWVLDAAAKRTKGTPHEDLYQREVFRYFTRTLATMADKTRDGIVATVVGPASVYAGVVERVLYADRPLALAREVENGAVFVSDFPLATDGAVCSAVNSMLKFALQRTLLRRLVGPETRPFVFVLDEYPNYVSSFDCEFFATCRSSLAGNVILIQGRESLLKALGGQSGEHETDVILGNCAAGHVHMRPTQATAHWLTSQVLGQKKQLMMSGGTSGGSQYHSPADFFSGGQPGHINASFSEQMVALLQPHDLLRMRCGSDAERGRIDLLRVPAVDGSPFERLTIVREEYGS